MKRGFDRKHRIADLIQKALATIILQEMADERFQWVTVVGAEVARDLSYAKIYVSVLSDDKDVIRETINALNGSVKPIRYALSKAVKLRITPELKFVYDESTAKGFHIGGLIDDAMKRSGEE